MDLASLRNGAGLDITPLRNGVPVVTSYSVKGVRVHTLFLAFCCDLEEDEASGVAPRASDLSISEACWRSPAVDWGAMAPGNCVFAGRALWPAMGAAERAKALPHLDAATAECNAWAAEVGLHVLKESWRKGPG